MMTDKFTVTMLLMYFYLLRSLSVVSSPEGAPGVTRREHTKSASFADRGKRCWSIGGHWGHGRRGSAQRAHRLGPWLRRMVTWSCTRRRYRQWRRRGSRRRGWWWDWGRSGWRLLGGMELGWMRLARSRKRRRGRRVVVARRHVRRRRLLCLLRRMRAEPYIIIVKSRMIQGWLIRDSSQGSGALVYGLAVDNVESRGTSGEEFPNCCFFIVDDIVRVCISGEDTAIFGG